ncbi:MAG: hypothetical protein IJ838_06335 [Paludibacteraceae bacterium]|nr:hypothetical protein [Paludibacteraceae bacterium]
MVNRLRTYLFLLVLGLCTIHGIAQDKPQPLYPYSDTAVYQGTMLKVDAFMPIYDAARTKGKLQSYEVAFNVRLLNRYYPTLEGGYSFGTAPTDSTTQAINAGFLRVGMDFNPLKKSLHTPHALLVGLRVGTSPQHTTDAWGEVVAGCQVQIVSGFYMGWSARLKLLFTHRDADYTEAPVYIPGYGNRSHVNWGINYYFAWRF